MMIHVVTIVKLVNKTLDFASNQTFLTSSDIRSCLGFQS